jgi:prepilin-type N-terminal cleavage/methylation domain-containing protein
MHLNRSLRTHQKLKLCPVAGKFDLTRGLTLTAAAGPAASRSVRGMTLVELMVTVVVASLVLGLIATISQLSSADPPKAEELTGIQNYLAGTYVLQNSSRSGITNQLDYMDLHGLPPTYASTYVKQVYAVTPQQVSDTAKKHLQDERALIVIVGDRKVIEEQVKSFGEIVDK